MMDYVKRFNKLLEILQNSNLDGIFLAPSSDLEYTTGLKLHPDSRFKGVMISKNGESFALCPSLYREEMEAALPESTAILEWKDGQGFVEVFKDGIKALGLNNGRVAFNAGVKAVDMLDAVLETNITCVNGASVLSPLRRSKDEQELDFLRAASRNNDAVMEDLKNFIRPGVTEKDIAKHIMFLHEKRGGVPRYPVVASGINGSMPHYGGQDNRIIQNKDIIIVDTGAWYNSYNCDMTRMFFIGDPTEEQKKVYRIVLEAQNIGEEEATLGAIPEDIDNKARKVIETAGYGAAFTHRLGHGTGMDPHEDPFIVAGNKRPLEAGNCFSIEPGIYLKGAFGVRIENLIAITETGPEVLNKLDKEMIIL